MNITTKMTQTNQKTQKTPRITQERLKELLDYDPLTGVFTWHIRPNRRIFEGDVAGRINKSGYISIRLDNKEYTGHRLAWLWCYGKFPDHEIDHINQKRDDNRLENLREVTKSENSRNRGFIGNNTGIQGIWYNRRTGKYHSRIKLNGKAVFQKVYSEEQLDIAIQERREKLLELGFHINHGVKNES